MTDMLKPSLAFYTDEEIGNEFRKRITRIYGDVREMTEEEVLAVASDESFAIRDENIATVRCLITGNPVGTDTWQVGQECPCDNCRGWSRDERMDLTLADMRGLSGNERPNPTIATSKNHVRDRD